MSNAKAVIFEIPGMLVNIANRTVEVVSEIKSAV